MVIHLRQFLIMKTAIFNKKKISIVLSLIFLLLSVSILCSFAPPSFSGLSALTVSIPSQIDLENLMSIVNLQHSLGFFNNLLPVACFMSTSNNQLRLILTRSDVDFSFSLSSGSWVFAGGAGNGRYYRMTFTSAGFSLQSMDGASVRSDRLLFYRSSLSSPFVVNSDYLFSDSQNGQDSISDVFNYYSGLYNVVLNYEDNLFSAESVGFSDGYDEGYSEGESFGSASGYRDGFDDGREEGYTFGYDDGYEDGYKRGDDVGYQTGYSDGYDEGYSEGYETGLVEGSYPDFDKPGQIIAQFWRYVDDSDYQGIKWFCTISHNGISAFRWCTEDEIYSHYLNCEVYDYVYETNLYFQKNPLEFNYFVPQLVREESPYSGALSIKSVEYRFVDLYNQRAVIELGYDSSITQLLNAKYNEGIKDSNSLVNGVASIAKSPVESLRRALDFEIFGINVGAVAVGLVAILFAIWAYNKIRKLLPI